MGNYGSRRKGLDGPTCTFSFPDVQGERIELGINVKNGPIEIVLH